MQEQEHESFQKLSKESEVIEESSRQSRHPSQLKFKQPLIHTSNVIHSEILKDATFRSSFSLKERTGNWFSNCLKCQNSDISFVNSLDEAERRNPATMSQEYKKLVSDKILKIKIYQSSRLQLNANVMHPFVKIHIVDKNTGCYIKNTLKDDEPVIYHQEQITFFQKIERKYQTSQNDMILPFATSCCDFRDLGSSRAQWNQQFYINYPAHLLLNPDTIFLFEILDFNHQALKYRNTDDLYDQDNFFRVAWAFLRPVGIAKTHIGKQKIELYRYKFNSKDNPEYLSKKYIPAVYYDFIWSNHQKYDGFLTVQLNYTERPKYRIIDEDTSHPRHLFEEEHLDKKYLDRFASGQNNNNQKDKEEKVSQDLLKFYRNRDICEVPAQLIYKLESDKLGCYRVKFIGNNVYAACSNKKSTQIKVYSLEKGQLIMVFKGHRDIIYDLSCSLNQKYLITTGSDHMAKIWQIPEETGEFIDEDESEAYIRGECIHTAAVYSASVVHFPLQDTMTMLTCCFDGYVRVWECGLTLDGKSRISKQILINDYQRTQKKVYPTCSAVSQSNFFIVGDSIGDIRIYDFSKDRFSLRCLIITEDLKDDAILTVKILNKNHLIVQASDNLIRHYELVGNKLKLAQQYAGAVFESLLLNCSVSPDNKYLLCPSETGKPTLWDIFTGAVVPIDHLNLNIKGALTSCDWHSKYNLVVFSGFVQLCPIFVYGNLLHEAQIKALAAQTL